MSSFLLVLKPAGKRKEEAGRGRTPPEEAAGGARGVREEDEGRRAQAEAASRVHVRRGRFLVAVERREGGDFDELVRRLGRHCCLLRLAVIQSSSSRIPSVFPIKSSPLFAFVLLVRLKSLALFLFGGNSSYFRSEV
jgi:hypothetical protein